MTARVIADDACCGLTWITTGQLDQARSIMERTVRTLTPYVESGVPGRRPRAVLPGHAAQRRRRADRREPRRATFAELVERLDVPLPSLAGVEVVAQPHCHQASILGWAADKRILEKAGATVTQVAGCCGLAGNFGMEKGHYEVSVAVAETHLLPAVRANPDAVVLADGMSCRVQLDDLAQRPTMHLAEAASRRAFSPLVDGRRADFRGFETGLAALLNHRMVARGRAPRLGG